MIRTITVIVPNTTSQYRLDRYLSQRFSYHSRSAWQKEIKRGAFSVNGERIKRPSKIIFPGDCIEYETPGRREPPVDAAYSIVYEDEWFIAVNKSGDLPVHPAGCYFNNTLLMLMQQSLSYTFYPLHRLDRETSGIVCFARSAEFASILSKAMRDAQKTYIMVVSGHPTEDTFTCSIPLGNDEHSPVRKKRAAYQSAPEPACTHFSLIKRFATTSLLRAVLGTGRQHQIRAHCEYYGNYILGDKIYGGDARRYLRFLEEKNSQSLIEEAGFHRTALHAESLKLYHPFLKKEILITAPLPFDMQDLIMRQDQKPF
jgi:23S rRNA pseudouridine955/2504/2580 synthase